MHMKQMVVPSTKFTPRIPANELMSTPDTKTI